MSELAKYAKLMKLEPDADLSAIKQRYSEWQTRFQTQIGSDDPELEQKGRNNLLLLDQAYQVLAAEAAKRARAERTRQAPVNRSLATSIELATLRAGFSIYDCEKFELVTNRHVGHFKINWPYGKLTFYDNKIKLKALVFKAEIEYSDIESISRYLYMPMMFRIEHQAPDVYPTVILKGPGIGAKFKQLNEEHNLGLAIEYS